MGSPEHKEKIWNLIEPIKTGMLVTRDDKLGVHARPMHLVQEEYDGKLYFFTKTNSDKTQEVYTNDKVCITFSDQDKKTFVSLTGSPKMNANPELIDKFWNNHVAAWFPDGKRSASLLEIHVEYGEHWDSTTSSVKYLFEITKANVTDTQPDLGENEKF